MRKQEKEGILQSINILFREHEKVKNAIQSENFTSAQILLQQCQECAIQLGNVIEKKESENGVTISYIEQYCEQLYLAYAELDKDVLNPNKLIKTLKSSLTKVENSVKNDLKIRKEVVFFPYKASMWDSLESAYFRIKEQQDCDVHCVPIPYYDLRPDGSFGDMHYEGLEYPDNVEVIDWKNYHFEEIKPDMVFIHNPYDNMNYVTSVDPRFYAQNIKKYTDELIYIPYFILKEISPDDQTTIDGMKHFCFLPGVIYADKVIVQSENIRQIYINEFLKAAKENHFSGKYIEKRYLEQKILGLGSPKLEKIKNTKIEKVKMPAEWLKIIEKPDGNRKKIVFFNISINALLRDSEEMIMKKLPCTLDDLKAQRDEIALLWRPHPLFMRTIAAMRPQLQDMYTKIIEDYLMEGWGIYDDSSDIDRAVILSDIYYGNESSVVRLYETTCKPILIQEFDNFEPVKCTCTIGNSIYCLNSNGNSIYCLSLIENELINKWKYRLCDISFAYEKIFAYKDKVILIPRKSGDLAIFDPINITMEKIKLPSKNEFVTYYYVGSTVYLFPCIGNEIIVADLESQKMDCYELPDELLRGSEGAVFSYDIVKIEECIFLMIYGTNQIVEFNVANRQLKIHRLPVQYLINCLCNNAHNVWLMVNGGTIIEWDHDTNKLHGLRKFFTKDNILFGISVYVKETDEIWIPSIQQGTLLIYNVIQEQMTEMDLSNEGMFIWMIEKHNQDMWIFFDRKDAIFSIDIFTKKLNKIHII